MILIIGGKPLAVCGVDDVVRVETATEVRSVGNVSQPIFQQERKVPPADDVLIFLEGQQS